MGGKSDTIILEHGTYTIKARLVKMGCQERNVEDIVSVPPMVAKGDNNEVVVGFDTWKNAPNSTRVYAFDDETGDILVRTGFSFLMGKCSVCLTNTPPGFCAIV